MCFVPMQLHSLQQKCTILTSTALFTPWRSLPVTLLESEKAPFSILVAPSSPVEWHVHLRTNNCSPGMDFLIMHLKPMLPKCYRVWERERTAFPKGVRTLVCEEWASEHSSSSSSREKCRLRSPQTYWIRVAVFTRPLDDLTMHPSLRSTDYSAKKGEWMLSHSNRWLLHKFPCDDIKLILTAFSTEEITKWVEQLSLISLNVSNDK